MSFLGKALTLSPDMGMGGGSKSYSEVNTKQDTSSTYSSTADYDQRQVADGGGMALNGSGNTFTMADAGAIGAGRDIALAGLNFNSTNFQKMLDTADGLLAGQSRIMDVSSQLAQTLAAKATGTAAPITDDDKRRIMIVAVVLIAGWAVFRRKG